MSSSGIISHQIVLLNKALEIHPPDDAFILETWRDFQLIVNAADEIYVDNPVLQADATPRIIGFFCRTLNHELLHDDTGLKSLQLAARCLVACFKTLQAALLSKALYGPFDRTQAKISLQMIIDHAPELINDCWMTLRSRAVAWLENQSLDSNLLDFMLLFEFVATKRQLALTHSDVLKFCLKALASHPALRDLCLAFAIFTNNDQQHPTLFAMFIVSFMQSDRKQEVPTFIQLQRSRPSALSELSNRMTPSNIHTMIVFINSIIPMLDPGDLSEEVMAYRAGSLMWAGYQQCSTPDKRDEFVQHMICAQNEFVTRSPSKERVIRRLLGDYDFLRLIEKAIPTSAVDIGKDTLMASKGSRQKLQSLLLLDSTAFKPSLCRDFLHILDYLRHLGNRGYPNVKDLLSWWQGLAESVGISETELRADSYTVLRDIVGYEPVGCNWFKCFNYERACDATTLVQCAGCQTALYCGFSCYDRDWTEGGHASKCKRMKRRET
ncbi:hypothetical protein FRB93_010017 [Tulasnella sp. JGI-2019a]|nr:hypothetical protein FRB93_010017 [Tulasnella sp. JGI-2019a]